MNIEEIKKRHNTEIMFMNKLEAYNHCRDDVSYLLAENQRLAEALQQIKYEYEQGTDDKVAYRMYKEALEAHKLSEKND